MRSSTGRAFSSYGTIASMSPATIMNGSVEPAKKARPKSCSGPAIETAAFTRGSRTRGWYAASSVVMPPSERPAMPMRCASMRP